MGFNAEYISHRPAQAQRYAEYAGYVLVSPLVGLVRLIVAVAGLIGDKYEKSAIESVVADREAARAAETTHDGTFFGRGRALLARASHRVDDLAEKAANLGENLVEGKKSTKAPELLEIEARMARNWQQLARALSELVVVGSFFYAFTEAANRNVPVIQHHHIRAIALENSLLPDSTRSSSPEYA